MRFLDMDTHQLGEVRSKKAGKRLAKLIETAENTGKKG
jgi:hypothetical protein